MITRRPPHLAFLCILCVASGLSIILSGPPPGSIEESLQPWQVQAWAWSLLIGGASVLFTMTGRSAALALKRERLVLAPMSLACLAYASAALTVVGASAMFPAGMAVVFAVANFIRIWQVTKWLRGLRG